MKASLPANESARLAELRGHRILDTAPEPSLERIVRMATRFFAVPMAAVSLVDEDRQWLKACCGMPSRQIERDYSFCAHAILGSDIFVVRDAFADSRFADNPLVLGPPYIRFYAGAPLISATGSALGSLCILDTAPRRFTVEEGHMLVDLAATVMNELSLRQLANGSHLRSAESVTPPELTPVREPRISGRPGGAVSPGLPESFAHLALSNHFLYEGIAERERSEIESTRLDRLAHESVELIMLASLDGRVTYLNDSAREVLGIGSLAEARRTKILDYVPADQRTFFNEHVFPKLFERGRWEATFPLRHFRSEGLIPVVWSMSVVRDPETGEPMSIASAIRDSNQPAAGGAARLSAVAETEIALRAKSAFLSRMSHELRTPLNAILGFGQLLEMQSIGSEQKECSSHIVKAGSQLLDLINDVLDISKLESGQVEFLHEPVRVADAVAEVLNLARPLAAQKGIFVQKLGGLDESLTVMADSQRFKQVLLNLIVNAIKFNREDGLVRLTCQRIGVDRLRVSVEDQGPGMTPEELARIFVPFERMGAGEAEARGTGLGLVLSKYLVEALGGTLGVESTPGSGSTFWLELPNAGISPAPPALPSSAASGGEGERSGGKVVDEATVPADAALPPGDPPIAPAVDAVQKSPAVLVVEREESKPGVTEQLGHRRPDIRLFSAWDGLQGLAVAGECDLDLVVLNLPLPDMEGHQFLDHLRSSASTRSIPVVVVNVGSAPGAVDEILLAGARACLNEPWEIERLLEWIPTPRAAAPAR